MLPAAAPLAPPPPRWLRPGASLCSEARRLLLLRAGGLCRAGSHPGVVAPTEAYARQLSHVLTVRGHRFAVYCVCYDRSGRFIVTGSDDRLVKVGAAGCLLIMHRTCAWGREHAGQAQRGRRAAPGGGCLPAGCPDPRLSCMPATPMAFWSPTNTFAAASAPGTCADLEHRDGAPAGQLPGARRRDHRWGARLTVLGLSPFCRRCWGAAGAPTFAMSHPVCSAARPTPTRIAGPCLPFIALAAPRPAPLLCSP